MNNPILYIFISMIDIDIQEKCYNWIDLNKTYNIVKLKPNKQGTKNILT